MVQEVKTLEIASTGRIGGFDFGLKTFLTNDENEAYRMPQYFQESLKEIARLNRALSRKQPGSNNYQKAKWRLARAHARLANKRRDTHFKLARRLALEYDILCFEDLNIQAMKRLWGRKVSDLGFSQFLAIQKHIAAQMGKTVVQIDRFEPSTTVCSVCGHRQPMPLRIRVFSCQNPECHTVLGRDHNAARTIKRVGASTLGLEGIRRELLPAALV